MLHGVDSKTWKQSRSESWATQTALGVLQEVVELARDKESLLILVAACKEAQGAHLDLVQEQLYNHHLKAVAAQVSRPLLCVTASTDPACLACVLLQEVIMSDSTAGAWHQHVSKPILMCGAMVGLGFIA